MKMTSKLIITIMTAIMILCLSSCVANVTMYDHGNNYTAGDFETKDEITAIDIDWSSGNVNVSYHDKDTVSVTETCNIELKDSQKVHTWLDGKTLHIRYCKSGENFNLTNAEKKLQVSLPKTIELDTLNYDGSSADVSFNDVTATTIKVDTSSGTAKLSNCSADTFKFDSSSGDIILDQKGESESIEADASSGDITVNAETVNELNFDTSSGEIKLNINSSEKISADTSSGKCELHFKKVPSEMKLDSASGDITIYLPKDTEFSADVDTASGDFDSEISLTKKNDTYISGSGNNTMDIDTASGDIQIKIEE